MSPHTGTMRASGFHVAMSTATVAVTRPPLRRSCAMTKSVAASARSCSSAARLLLPRSSSSRTATSSRFSAAGYSQNPVRTHVQISVVSWSSSCSCWLTPV